MSQPGCKDAATAAPTMSALLLWVLVPLWHQHQVRWDSVFMGMWWFICYLPSIPSDMMHLGHTSCNVCSKAYTTVPPLHS